MKRVLVASALLLAAAGCAQPTEAPPPVKAVVNKPDPFASSRAWLNSGLEQQAEAYSVMLGNVGPNQTCMRDVAHSYRGLFPTTGTDHEDAPSKLHPGQHHEYAEYAEGVCDDQSPVAPWRRVDQGLADALAEGSEADSHRRWEACVVAVDDTAWIVCPDGHVEVS